MSFATPLALLLLLLAPLLLRSHRPRANEALSASTYSTLGELPRTFKERIHAPLLTALLLLAYCCLVIALARPQSISEVTETNESGRDIILLLDVSGSMQALDFFIDGNRVDRLTALKKVTAQFIRERIGDRMGLIVFGDHAYTQCPLTMDREVLTGFVAQLSSGIAGYGTAIGDGLAIALKRLREIEAESRVIILVTDGKNTSGTLGTKQGAELAKSMGIKIHAIGIGGNKPAPFPVTDQFGRKRIIERVFEYDEASLREIADVTGGEYFNAVDLEGLQMIYKTLDQLEKREATATQYLNYQELFEPFAAAALLLLLLHQVLSATIFIRVP